MMRIRDLSKKMNHAAGSVSGLKGIGKQVLLVLAGIIAFMAAFGLLTSSTTPGKYAASTISHDGIDRIEMHNGVYVGNITANRLSGEGNFTFLDGTIYAGSWRDSVMSGDGICEYPDIGRYKGDFVDGRRSGEGTFTWNDGRVLTGTWKNDEVISGEVVFPDGSHYKGTFEDGHVDSGKYFMNPSPTEEETGYTEHAVEFKEGKPYAEAYKLQNGFQYVGSVGVGTANIVYPNGDTYQGDVDDKELPDGRGEYTWIVNGTVTAKYTGQWSGGTMNGVGIYYYSAKKLPSIQGNFVEGVPDGTCTYTKEDGNTFKVTWVEGKCIKVE